ncbi:MAG: hypothetical protein LH606_05295 [Cytophagaceae bacterium]|nr:hypothetical protein [Cytophagaceae bacterium]
MQSSLHQIKKLLSEKYLGKAGIHGLGVSTAQQAIRVYVDSDLDPARFAPTLNALEKLAIPFRVIVVPEEAPSMRAA